MILQRRRPDLGEKLFRLQWNQMAFIHSVSKEMHRGKLRTSTPYLPKRG